MTTETLQIIRDLLKKCTSAERTKLFEELREGQIIHPYEKVLGASAETILEAIHRAPELTRRMLRGVVADAAFSEFVVPALKPLGWRDTTPDGNFSYDYVLTDAKGPITVQIKLQRSEKGAPVKKSGKPYGFNEDVYFVETQKTRGGLDGEKKKTRPYKYGEFDLLAVSLQPSTGQWNRYTYTVGNWLIASAEPNEIATMQPVTIGGSEYWTDNFSIAADWFRSNRDSKRLRKIKSR
jgi:hypothetical protein